MLLLEEISRKTVYQFHPLPLRHATILVSALVSAFEKTVGAMDSTPA
jgi:hypothetical protein